MVTIDKRCKKFGKFPNKLQLSSTLNRSSMKNRLYIYLFFLAFFINQNVGKAQEVDFTLRYNATDNQYEVYGQPNFSQAQFFVGGGSQLSIVFPASIPNNPLVINTVEGGIWTDNSRIYAPSATPNLDYHGIASNGSFMDWTFGTETLLFTFSIPNETCVDGIRLFENGSDPSSAEPSMRGADFANYFANAFTFADAYRSNYNNQGISCGPPAVFINNINTNINTNGQSCGSIVSINPDATYTATVCKSAVNGNATVNVNNTANQLCVDYLPNTDYVGQDSVCVEICDENDVCVETMVLINIIGNTPITPITPPVNCTNQTSPNVTFNTPICIGDSIILRTDAFDSTFTYEWTNGNGNVIGNQPRLAILSTNSLAISPYRITRTQENCTPVTSLSVPIEVIDFSQLNVQNNGPICAEGTVSLSATGLDIGTYNWYLAGTNNLVATGRNPSIANLTATTTYRLEVSHNGCSNTNLLETTVIVDQKPALGEIPRSITVCRGENVLITPTNDPATGEEIRYIWKGPNDFLYKNNTTEDEFPLFLENITPEQSGSYSIDITSKNGCEVDSRSVIINVVDDLEAPILSGTTELVCNGDAIEITATQQNDPEIEFEWFVQNDNDDLTLLQKTVHPTLLLENVNGSNSGKYLVRTTRNGCVSGFSNTIFITVFDVSSTIEATNNGPVCQGQSVQLSGTAIPNAVYNWYMAGSNELVASGQTINIPAISTTTTYELEVSLESCSNIIRTETTVVLESKPTITNITKTATYCIGSEVVLSAMNGTPNGQEVLFTWTGPNNFNFTGMTTNDSFELVIPNITVEKSGTYTLEISSNNSCEIDARSVIVNVDEALEAPQLIPLQRVVCGGNPIELTASLQNDADVQFEWFLQNEEADLFLLDITNVPSIIIDNPTAANSGKYLARVRKGDCVSGYSNTEIITILDEASNFAATNSSNIDNQICEGGFVQLSVPFLEGATYQWFGPAGFTSDRYNPLINNISGFNAGDYFAVITIEGCTGVVSSSTTVYVNSFLETPVVATDSVICEGETLMLEVTSKISSDNDVRPLISWYDNQTDELIATTTDAILQLSNAQSSNSGEYYAILSQNGCESAPSNVIEVSVKERERLVAYAGKDASLCTAGTIQLEALANENTTGIWTSPTGAIIEEASSIVTSASNLKVGENQFIWTIQDRCGQTAFDTLFITILETSGDLINAGPDQNICELEAINLNASALEESTGRWSQHIDQANQGVIIQNPQDPNTLVEGLSPGNVYQFEWTLSTNSCPDFATDNVFITVNEEPEEIAFITEENTNLLICESDQTSLIAETPLFSTGRWTTDNGAQIANPTLPETMAGDIPVGDNLFIWTLSNEACADFSSDTINIYKEEAITANADLLTLNFNDSITFDVIENDVFYKMEDLTFRVTKFPDNGTLREEEDGTLTYIPQRNYFGEDNFRYKLCSNFCEEVCDTAIVNIVIDGLNLGSPEGCFIPNILSPNNDDNNDKLLIGCLSEFPDASIVIFNRWGDEIYQAAPYQNDWEGTHNGNPLPAGTYYYTLRLTPTSDPIQDFITIFR